MLSALVVMGVLFTKHALVCAHFNFDDANETSHTLHFRHTRMPVDVDVDEVGMHACMYVLCICTVCVDVWVCVGVGVGGCVGVTVSLPLSRL